MMFVMSLLYGVTYGLTFLLLIIYGWLAYLDFKRPVDDRGNDLFFFLFWLIAFIVVLATFHDFGDDFT